MAARGPGVPFSDFMGGLNTMNPEYNLALNESPDLDNIVLLDKGFMKRNGDSAWNSSAMVSSSTAVHGMGYFVTDGGTEYLNAVAGTKFFADSGLAGTMTDVTGVLTITTGQNNIWNSVNFNNLQIWFGGAPDAPFKYSGTGNAAALGGTPPTANNVFGANNRIFAMNTTANPSRIFWPIVSNPEDWTGTGSGSADVAASDGDSLQCGVVTGPDTAILFKKNSTHMMILTRQPFPIYQLQRGVGIAGKNAWAFANGEIFLITPGLRMRSTTDGLNFKTYPNNIDNIFDTINPSRIGFIQGAYYQQNDWIVFTCSTGSNTTNNYAIIWDLKRKCFLRCTTGFKSNVMGLVQNRRLFAGHYNGKLFEKLKLNVFSDASETSPGAIDGHWRTPFSNFTEETDITIHPAYVDVVALTESASTLDISYGFDFTSAQTTQTFSLQAVGGLWDSALWDVAVWGGQNATILRQFVLGRGNLFSFMLRNATASQGYTVQGAMVRTKSDKARKVFANT